MNDNNQHHCPTGLCRSTPAQLAAYAEEARENSRQLLLTTLRRYPGMTVGEIGKLFGWTIRDVDQVLGTLGDRIILLGRPGASPLLSRVYPAS